MFIPWLFAIIAVAGAVPRASADAAFQRGDFAAALTDYAAQVVANPNDSAALLGLGTVELYRNDLINAKKHLMQAQGIDPNDPVIERRLRVVSQREKKPGEFEIAMQGSQAVVPFMVTDPLPLLHAKINGHGATLLIDTGAPAIGLTPDAAKRFGVASRSAGQGVFAGGRHAEVQEGRVESVELTDVTVRGVPAAILPGAIDLGGPHVDGAIGTIFLAQFLSTIDYRRGELILRPRSKSSTFELNASAIGAAREPMWLVGDHFIFAGATVNGAPDGLFNIDTGGAGPARAVPFSVNSVSLATFTQRNVPGLYFPNGDQYGIFPFTVAGTLSHEFFRKAALSFDFDAMQVIVNAES
jgi:hypothetical protein